MLVAHESVLAQATFTDFELWSRQLAAGDSGVTRRELTCRRSPRAWLTLSPGPCRSVARWLVRDAPEMAPLVSVVLPFYDDRETVGAAVKSVLGQAWSDLELIAVDDGSPDGSVEIVAELARCDDRVKLVRQANGGAAAARNAGLRAAGGRYCAFHDADDLWFPGKLERQLPLLGTRTLVFSDAWVEEGERRFPWSTMVHRSGGAYPHGDVYDELVSANFIPISSVVLPTPLVHEVGGFNESLRVLADWDLWLRLAAAGVSFDYVSEPLVLYRVRPGSLSSDKVSMRAEELRVFALHARHAPPARRRLLGRRTRTARKGLETSLRGRAWTAVLSGEPRAARRDLVASFRANPMSPKALAGLLLAGAPPMLSAVARMRKPG